METREYPAGEREGGKTLNRSRPVLFYVLIALLGVLTPASAAASAAAEHSTFTKWITTAPIMAGIVGGAVGDGSYAGEILKMTTGTTTVIEALYHFTGSKHSFTALVHVEQTGLKAVITGVVTEGWLKGGQVKGEYTQITSPQAPGDGTAFQGTLDILGGS
jgi:hypothetical protein